MTRSTRSPRAARALLAAGAVLLGVPLSAHAATGTAAAWRAGPAAAGIPVADGLTASVAGGRVRTLRLDRAALESALREPAAPARSLVLELPAPGGGLERFAVTSSPVMAPGLARRHPEIATYAGTGLDDRTATVRAQLSPLGFHASVRAARGTWYVEPSSHQDQRAYVSYFGRDLADTHGTFVERQAAALGSRLADDARAQTANPSVGEVLRTYRLALVTDPSYADFWGPANVTAGKVLLVGRVNQIYESELSIRLVLIDESDRLDLSTADLATRPNGPCGEVRCYDPDDLQFCTLELLNKTPTVVGQIVGAGSYDIGHVALGKNGGGIAGLGVVGGRYKAVGCTGLPKPIGDFYAVDYVAHEMGHQFGGNHTFDGTLVNCGFGNRNPATSVEPGSGSSIMAYAGICGQDDLQPHSDPYFSQRSFEEIVRYTTRDRAPLDEVQDVALTGFHRDGDSFTLSYRGQESPPIVRGVNYTPAGIEAAIMAIPGWPAGATVAVARFGVIPAYGRFGDIGFSVTFGGTLAGIDVAPLAVTSPHGVSGLVGEGVHGGPALNGGFTVTPTGNHPPVVTPLPRQIAIPYLTPFALTGSATDPDGDTVTYMWEQNDDGGRRGTSLVDNEKVDGPLFRQFGVALDDRLYDPEASPSPGENTVTTDPTRVFPDMAQILANDTNAETGRCPRAPQAPNPVPQPIVDCFSEFLPRPIYTGPMHFRLTARDGRGGVSSDDTKLVLVPGTGPFRVSSPNAATSFAPGSTQTVTWKVAGTAGEPIGATTVDILLSTDGGATFGTVLASGVPNDGSFDVVLPAVATSRARIMVRATGNVFFDVSDSDFGIGASGAARLPDGSPDLRALTSVALPGGN